MGTLTLRVYGLLLHQGQVLVSDEAVRGHKITKFPGGGWQYGEGPKETLVREVREELGVEALELSHFYTTDFFQRSAFHKQEVQVMAIYYTFRVALPNELPHKPLTEAAERFRWLQLSGAQPSDVSLPIDQHVLAMLLGQDKLR
jgi:8-oxo-dGTP diphosphatase